MQVLNESHFALLTAVAAPAVLTNASSVLCMGIGNRIARVVDRTRAVSVVMAEAADEKELCDMLKDEIATLNTRSKFLMSALRLGYAALGGFAAEALVAVAGGVLGTSQFHQAAKLVGLAALIIGILSVGSFVLSCFYMVRETLVALTNLELETATLQMYKTRLHPKREEPSPAPGYFHRH